MTSIKIYARYHDKKITFWNTYALSDSLEKICITRFSHRGFKIQAYQQVLSTNGKWN